MTKLRVGILLGGKSSEKEISLESARHVYNNLDEEKYERLLLFVDENNLIWGIAEPLLWMNTTADISLNLKKKLNKFYIISLKRKWILFLAVCTENLAKRLFPDCWKF